MRDDLFRVTVSTTNISGRESTRRQRVITQRERAEHLAADRVLGSFPAAVFPRLVGMERVRFWIDVTTRTVSDYSEDGEHLDGDVREVEPDRREDYGFDRWDHEEYGSAVEWAVHVLNRSVWPESVSDYPLPERPGEDVHLTRSTEHAYLVQRDEVTVYLRGSWTPEQRAEVFRKSLPNLA